ncbi:MAG: GDSL-type esterase/lipase family protein [Candidatus Bathyarchaeota archaeon]|nr:GDSL-type esterase/lipase family protein [Candidatus Bathyarchaeota archaeon]
MKKNTLLSALTIILVALALSLTAYYLTAQLSSSPIRVACVGDSITKGFHYPQILGELLGPTYVVQNFGTGGASVAQNAKTPYINQSIFLAAKKFQPDIVIIMLGTNDASPINHQYNGTFVSDYLKLINQFRELDSAPQIWLVEPPPIFNNGTGLSTHFFADTIVPLIQQTAQQAQLPLIDLYTVMANRSDLLWDGVHPTPTGAEVIASTIYDAITNSTS